MIKVVSYAFSSFLGLSLNRQFPFINLDTNTICTPYMQQWETNKVIPSLP